MKIRAAFDILTNPRLLAEYRWQRQDAQQPTQTFDPNVVTDCVRTITEFLRAPCRTPCNGWLRARVAQRRQQLKPLYFAPMLATFLKAPIE